MSFSTLALISAAGLLGPLLAAPRRLQVPVLIGELAAGIALGRTGLQRIDSADPTFAFMAEIGFALIMFVAGSHVPLRNSGVRSSAVRGTARATGVAAIAVVAGWLLSRGFGTGHAALYAVLIASSSAALALPLIDQLHNRGGDVLDMLAQVAVADILCIVALPLAIQPSRAGRAALGVLVVGAAVIVAYLLLRAAERSGLRKRVHRFSERHLYAIELRISLFVLFLVAALATTSHVSVMLAGFGLGLAVTAVGEPRRLAHQVFALTEGFFGPLFFVWIGAGLNLRALGSHPRTIGLGVALGAAAVLAHSAMHMTGQRLPLALIASAQLGVPVAAITVGTQLGLLAPGEDAAIILGALVTVAAASGAAIALSRAASARHRQSSGATPPAATAAAHSAGGV